MPATRYKIWQTGGPVGQGASNSFHVGVAGVAKMDQAALPFVVANELICSLLARAILLPIPPGFIIDHQGVPCYVSLNFNLAGEDLPPVDAAVISAQQPTLSCGIVLFDVWVVNRDRHSRNIANDKTTGKVHIFDHSHAFFSGRASLETNRNQLGIGGHCLVPELTTFKGLHDWLNRINGIPEYYVREAIASAVKVGLPDVDRDFCSDFLLERRKRLVDLIKANRNSFSKIQPPLWDEFDTDGGIQ